jgi:hypothetical protein
MTRTKRPLTLNLQMFAEDPPADPNPPKDPEQTVPYSRFSAVNAKAKDLETQLGAYAALGSAEDIAARIAALAEFEKAEEERKKAEMTEAQRLQAELEAARAEKSDYESRLTEAEQRHKQSTINAEFRLLAKEAGVVDAAVALKLVDLATAQVGEDGAVTGVAEALEALKTSAPYLFAKEPVKPKPLGEENNPQKNGDKTSEQVLNALAEKARKSGRPEDRIAYSEAKAKLNK